MLTQQNEGSLFPRNPPTLATFSQCQLALFSSTLSLGLYTKDVDADPVQCSSFAHLTLRWVTRGKDRAWTTWSGIAIFCDSPYLTRQLAISNP